MRKIFIWVGVVIAALLVVGWVAWESRARIAAHMISKHLHVPARMQSLEIDASHIDISEFWLGTPRGSRTSTSFSAQEVDIDMNVKRALKDPLIIDQIEISNIFVSLEFYQNGETNWSKMLASSARDSKKSGGKDYLIRTLILENLTVEVTEANGQSKRYPTISKMEFHNINNETGFPIEEIEKAIFNLMMQDIFKKFDLFQLLPSDSPLRLIPRLFN